MINRNQDKQLYIMGIVLFVLIAVIIISYFIPIEKRFEIKTKNKWETGGPVAECYYNMYGVKIKEKIEK